MRNHAVDGEARQAGQEQTESGIISWQRDCAYIAVIQRSLVGTRFSHGQNNEYCAIDVFGIGGCIWIADCRKKTKFEGS